MNNVNSVYRAIEDERSRYTHRTGGHVVPVVHGVHAVHAKHRSGRLRPPTRLRDGNSLAGVAPSSACLAGSGGTRDSTSLGHRTRRAPTWGEREATLVASGGEGGLYLYGRADRDHAGLDSLNPRIRNFRF